MKEGKTLQQLATQVQTERDLARDYRVPQSMLRMNSELNLETVGQKNPLVIKPRELMHGQIADKLGVPTRYYNRMMTEAPELLRENVNTWLGRTGERRFIRTLAHNDTGAENFGRFDGRAFLGSGYKPLDNFDMMSALIPPLLGSGLQVKSSEITERRLYMQLVTEKIQAVVQRMVPGTHERINDPIQMGLVVSNSEVGCGALSIQVLVYRLVCTNGLIVGEDLPGFRRIHLGGQFTADDGILKDETKRLTDAAVWAQARDVITAAVQQTTLNGIADRLNGIARVMLPDPEKAIELVARKFDLGEDERKGVMRNLIAGGDVSQWGLTNAVTALANEAESYDRTIDLETIGGKVAALPAGTFGLN